MNVLRMIYNSISLPKTYSNSKTLPVNKVHIGFQHKSLRNEVVSSSSYLVFNPEAEYIGTGVKLNPNLIVWSFMEYGILLTTAYHSGSKGLAVISKS